MAQRMLAGAKLGYQIFDVGTELFGLFLSVTDLEASHGELSLGIMEVIGGELADAPKP
jgi:hypothetical protein